MGRARSYFGHKYRVESIIRDDGTFLTGLTTAAPYQSKLLLTGVGTKAVTVCDL